MMLTDVNQRQIKEFLETLAKKKMTTGYVKLNEKLKLGLDFSKEEQMEGLYTMLDNLSNDSFKENGTLLGVLVVNKMRNRPGPRFFKGAEKIVGFKIEDTDDFFEQHREKLYSTYPK
jgi:hypothetical protein